jgi:hypothetical protein
MLYDETLAYTSVWQPLIALYTITRSFPSYHQVCNGQTHVSAEQLMQVGY